MNAPRRSPLILAAVLALAFAPAPFPRPERRDGSAPDFVGNWSGTNRMRVTPDRVTFLDGAQMEYELQIDRRAKPPTYDLKGIQGKRSAGRHFRGVYRVEGDVLTLTY